MNKIGIFTAQGLEEIEALTVVDLLRRAQIEVTMISISEKIEVAGAHNITFLADKTFEQVDFNLLDGIVLPGGMPGTTNLMKHAGVNKVIEEFFRETKLVAAICAAPSVLGQAGILKGKHAVCYPGFEEQLTGAIVETNPVERDGNIITSQGMGTAISFALEIIAYFKDEQAAKDMGASIMYRG